ncbi:class I SAM-dependent methyltransferase [Paraburkholderia sp. Tr-20389]|uniref:SAM-dependent methyltransferase n=1 Tax=Paraburkholderia sp. Tr-20389 TaxID=2703903 RepID=UPI0019822FC3|nr:methyltransferase domain-containing protein [Paraburkholderia sp. Tr-20389]MBN3753883.1 class I SAM-dependent methyltransferase [Paraburkholderia sp. Tr-20389]
MVDAAGIAQHYGPEGLLDRLTAALSTMGRDAGPLRMEELAPLDQFHSRGLAATVELARALSLDSSMRVLDIGSGLGGPSRYLAATYGCTVHGVDLSLPFVEAATFLAERTGLSGLVSYRRADALHLPFDAGEFDVAWTQHVAMNIADRVALYRETSRVLRAGGRFAIFDVVAASDTPLHFPVPWARGPEASFLVTADRMRALLVEQGFRPVSQIDTTQAALTWFSEREKARAQQTTPPALGLHLAMGPGFAEMTANLARNLREGRAALVQAIYEKS